MLYVTREALASLVRRFQSTWDASPELVEVLQKIAGGVWDRYRFPGEREDFQQDCLLRFLRQTLAQIDPDNNPHSYLTRASYFVGLNLRTADSRRAAGEAGHAAELLADAPARSQLRDPPGSTSTSPPSPSPKRHPNPMANITSALTLAPLAGYRTYIAAAALAALAGLAAYQGDYQRAASLLAAAAAAAGLRSAVTPPPEAPTNTTPADPRPVADQVADGLLSFRLAAKDVTKVGVAALAVLALAGVAAAFDTVPSPVSPSGVRATIDIPAAQHMRNTGGSDGAGLCVFTSLEVSGRWHNVPAMRGLQKYMTRRPGGGYPEKVDLVLTAHCAEQGVPVPAYLQHTGGDEAFLDLCMKTGRMPCITYAGVDNLYGTPILHMVDLAHIDGDRGAIIDNNRPGEWVWMTRKQLLDRWRGLNADGSPMRVRQGGQVFAVGGGWAIALLGPPPPPYAAKPVEQTPEELPEVMNFGVAPQAPAAAETNFGVDLVKLRASARKYSLNGTEVSKTVAFAAVLADDSDRFAVTFVGTTAPTLPASIRDKAHVQSYPADAWPVKQFGLKAGVTVRKPAVGRVGAEVLQLDTFDAAKVAAAVAGDGPKPVDPTPAPSPIGAVTIGIEDLTDAAKARLSAAGIGAVSFTVVPAVAPKPMPAPTPVPKPAAEAKPVEAKPAGAVNAAGVPTEPAPPGKRWVKLGTLADDTPWKLEDAAAAPAFTFPQLRSTCPGGVCPLPRPTCPGGQCPR